MKMTESATIIFLNAHRLGVSIGNRGMDTKTLFAALMGSENPAADVLRDSGLDFYEMCEQLGADPTVASDSINPAELGQAMNNANISTRRIISQLPLVSKRFGCDGYIYPAHILAITTMKNREIEMFVESFGAHIGEIKNDLSELLRETCDTFIESRQSNRRSMPEATYEEDVDKPMDGDEAAQFSRKITSRGRGKGDSKKFKNLENFGKNLTELAKDGKIDPIIGREEEINRIMQILARRTKNNPCLVGDPGVGKTAIAEGLALKISQGDVPELLKDKVVFSVDINSMVAGSKYRGDFEERMQNVLKEATENPEVILFIDEIHMLVGAGSGDGSKMDAANIMKPMLARNELQLIGATTMDEYSKCIEKDSALERRFQKVIVDEPTTGESILILKGLRPKYEEHHKIYISDDAIEQAVMLSNRYVTDRFLPDKAVDLIDEAAARMRINFVDSDEKRKYEKKLEEISAQKKTASDAYEFETAEALKAEEDKIKEKIAAITIKTAPDDKGFTGTLTSEHIANVLAGWTGIPVAKINQTDTEKLKNLEEELKQRVIGQDEAVHSIARAVRRSRLGLKDPTKPSGSFIFMGTTGVGKTELAKALAEVMFGGEKNLIRIDMSEYMEKNDVNKLIGAPPGYVGYEEAGQLTEAVRRQPYSVVLFDEIEKAHPDIFNVMLQILDDGRLTDGKGRVVDFKNTIVIMTSNVGARLLTAEAGRRIGFDMANDDDKDEASRERLYGGKSYDDAKGVVMEELKKTFTPEFINRVDEVIFFRMLSRESMIKIVDIMLGSVNKLVKNLGITMEVSDSVKEYLAKEGYDPQYGARPLKRVVQSKIEDTFSEAMLDGAVTPGCVAVVDMDEDGKSVKITGKQLELETVSE